MKQYLYKSTYRYDNNFSNNILAFRREKCKFYHKVKPLHETTKRDNELKIILNEHYFHQKYNNKTLCHALTMKNHFLT